MEIDSPENMMRHIRFLKNEVERLKKSLRTTELQRKCLLPSEWQDGTCRWFWLLVPDLDPFSTTFPLMEGWSPSQLPPGAGSPWTSNLESNPQILS